MQFGPLRFPSAGLQGLATAAHCRRQGLGTHLLMAAERQMAESGRAGWTAADSYSAFLSPYRLGIVRQQLGLHGHAACCARPTPGAGPRLRRSPRIQVRPWRRWEEDAIARVYRQNLAGSYGLLERSPRLLALAPGAEGLRPVLCGPGRPRPVGPQGEQHAARRLRGHQGRKNRRAGHDPDRRKAAMELSPGPAATPSSRTSGASRCTFPPTALCLAYFRGPAESSPPALRASRVLHGAAARSAGAAADDVRRVCRSGPPRPDSPGRWNSACWSTGGSIRSRLPAAAGPRPTRLGRSYLRLNVADFTRLLLGQLDWDRALEEGRVAPSTGLARDAGLARSFPRCPSGGRF